MDKIALFYNPVAGGGTFHTRLDTIISIMQEAGLQVVPWRIRNNKQLLTDMAAMDLEGFHTIIAAGGDGTVHGVVNAMMHLGIKVPLGIFPIGTANDTARNLGISTDLEGYCRVITDGQAEPVDLGKINQSYFINIASAGFMTEVAHQVSPKSKNLLGKGAYYLSGALKLSEMKSFELRVEVDGQSFICNAFLFLLLNGKGAGGFNEIVPTAAMQDGLLDLMIIKDGSPAQLLSALRKSLVGEHLEDSVIIYVQGKKFRLETTPNIETDLDGEAGHPLPWDIEVIKHGIQVRVP
ncbi:diacylglycerol/lipid kinase family protein [Desulfuribacillus alkaliarsenatis]|uniref:DAGKc domain-containing protein n=1 Tax=Desulfuribacillus alkaliarsenatis TaxID=766136 RepID=A0A1E5G3Q6_9FIRM|nr:YegS/Rv2252/BmrU family lipid kinase [Desulfuribacillus alkaliarsenatis]OEF97616.1 hypothetical protein BHF68_14570 [Desulfuribacillus alkaliarsenatis]